MLTPERLRAIKERCEQATPGPWRWDDTPWGEGKRLFAVGRKDQWGDVLTLLDDGSAAGEYSPTDATEADRDFIAHAREDVPLLVAEVERLHRFVKDIRRTARHWRRRAKVMMARGKASDRSDDAHWFAGQAEAFDLAAWDLEIILVELLGGNENAE